MHSLRQCACSKDRQRYDTWKKGVSEFKAPPGPGGPSRFPPSFHGAVPLGDPAPPPHLPPIPFPLGLISESYLKPPDNAHARAERRQPRFRDGSFSFHARRRHLLRRAPHVARSCWNVPDRHAPCFRDVRFCGPIWDFKADCLCL